MCFYSRQAYMLETRRNKPLRNDGKTRKMGRHLSNNLMQNISNYDEYFITGQKKSDKSLTKMSKNHLWLIDHWLAIQIHIAEGLRHIHTNGKHHGLLCSDNINVDISGNVRIVDFGSPVPELQLLVPELSILAGLKSGLKRSELLDDIFTKNAFLQTVDNLFYNWSMDGFLNSIEIGTDGDLQKFMKTYLPCSDIWTLGCSLFNIYMDFIADSAVSGSKLYRNNHRSQMKIFEGMLNPDPRKRYTVDMVLNELYSMRMDCV